MPLTPFSMSGALLPALAASGMLGTGTPQFALSVANGAVLYAQAATVISADTGTIGVGASAVPLVVLPQLLLPNLLTGFAAQQILGVMAPALATGLSIGLSIGFATGLVTTVHPTVGVGAGVARVTGGSAIPFMILAFASGGMIGQGAVKQATAIGIGLDITFAAFVMPIPIVGAPGPSPSAGAGFGKIV